MNNTRRLGKGLEALLGEDATNNNSSTDVKVMQIDINMLDANPNQPRRDFGEESMDELKASVSVHGVIQPLLVTKALNGRYMIIAGERRWRAARAAGLSSVPAIVKDYSDRELMEVSIIENLQREDLNPIEESEAMRSLVEIYGLTQEEVAERIGKSRSAVANSLRILNLPEHILEYLRSGQLSAGHARALLALENEKMRDYVADEIVKNSLSVRQAEALAYKNKKEKQEKRLENDIHLASAENALRDALGTRVKLTGTASRGKITIEYFNKDDLDRIYERIIGI